VERYRFLKLQTLQLLFSLVPAAAGELPAVLMGLRVDLVVAQAELVQLPETVGLVFLVRDLLVEIKQ
jgi:hypothetical protein